jgi:hypothetical protein
MFDEGYENIEGAAADRQRDPLAQQQALCGKKLIRPENQRSAHCRFLPSSR